MRITRKLGLLVAVPLVAVLAFAALAVTSTGGEAVRAERLRELVVAGAAAGELVYRLQAERAAAVLELTGNAGGAEAGDPAATFEQRAVVTDQAVGGYQRARAALSSLPAGTGALLGRVDGQIAELVGLRAEVTSGVGRASTITFRYRIVIADLVAFRESVGQAGGAPADVADRLRAAAALSQATEAVGLLQVAVVRVEGYGPLSAAAAQEITAARTGHIEALQTFEAFATPAWRAALERSSSGADALAAQVLEDGVARTAPGAEIDLDPVDWAATMDARMQRLRQVETGIDDDILAEVTALRDAQRRLTGGQIAAVVLAVAVALALAAWLGRPVVRGLVGLRDAALRVAGVDLPAAVGRLDESDALGGLSPEQFADQEPAPVRVRGRDELAEVGAAFNAVHREAIRTAAEQAKLRLSVAAIMRNLARRGQKLTDRLTAALDEVERDELNPKRLSQLYQLDLMATLLGGTNESLLVLGGAGAAQVRTQDEQLADLLRAALGRVEQYQRIEVGVVDEGVAVRAGAVDDVVKLLAELLDNACRYSSPQSLVRVDARWLSDRVIVQVSDDGIGIDPGRRHDLNHRLATRPPLDLAAVEAMGLTVVSYLAGRHGIRVELKEAHRRGTIAEVTLPPDLVAIGSGRRGPVAVLRGVGVPSGVAAAPAVPGPLFRSVDPAVERAGAGGRGAAVGRVGLLARAELPAATSGPPAGRVGAPAEQPDLPWPPSTMPIPTAPTQPLRPLIYEEVQRSRWFTSPRELAPVGGGAMPVGGGAIPVGGDGGPVGNGDALAGSGDALAEAGSSWGTAADSGWQAAARAATPQAIGTTESGLPVRRPGAQLVPGGVADAAAAAPSDAGDWRDPARASAVAAAYARGLATGRSGGAPHRDRNGASG